MKSKKKWSFDVHCKECGSYLECEIEDVFIDGYTGVKMVQCCDCDSAVGIGNITFPRKINRRMSIAPLPTIKKNYNDFNLFDGVKVLSYEEEQRIIEEARSLRGINGSSLVTTKGN